jgi:hypothetical protein
MNEYSVFGGSVAQLESSVAVLVYCLPTLDRASRIRNRCLLGYSPESRRWSPSEMSNQATGHFSGSCCLSVEHFGEVVKGSDHIATVTHEL